jgi:uncharacterized protein (DUF302 family)
MIQLAFERRPRHSQGADVVAEISGDTQENRTRLRRSNMLYEREAKGSVEEVKQRLEQATKENKFGVIAVIDLKQKMQDKGVDFGPQCLILEVCNPAQAKKVLETNMSISTALPCRISVYEEGGKVKVSTIKPTVMLGLYKNPELASVAESVEETIIRIIDAAC